MKLLKKNALPLIVMFIIIFLALLQFATLYSGLLTSYYSATTWNSNNRTSSSYTCNRVIHINTSTNDPGSINKLRRELMMSSSNDTTYSYACYEKYFDQFASHFAHRLRTVKKHLNLHIPKTGGTSFCQMVKANNISSPPGNCYQRIHFIPLWCCYKWMDRLNFFDSSTVITTNSSKELLSNTTNPSPTTASTTTNCDIFDKKLPFQFVMNENYLDHPLCLTTHLYSLLLRPPTERVMSQEKHFLSFVNSKNSNMSNDAIRGRLNVIRNNYMLWSITSGLIHGGSGYARLNFVPQRKHISIAKDIISRLDFLLELTPPRYWKHSSSTVELVEECIPTMFQLMGLGSRTNNVSSSSILTTTHTNAGMGHTNTLQYNRSQYYKWNVLDVELYQYAIKLAKLDCDFFLRFMKEYIPSVEKKHNSLL